MKKFEVGKEYNVFNESEYSTWSHVVKCESRTAAYVKLVEYDENNRSVDEYKRRIRSTSLTEYVYLTSDSIVWAD